MDKKTFAIGVMTITGLFLLIANILAPHLVVAQESVTGNGYSVVTAPVVSGGDALYILDNDTGMMGAFVYEQRAGLKLMASDNVARVFTVRQTNKRRG